MNIEKYINSGVIEMYVMGTLAAEEVAEVQLYATQYPEIKAEIERVADTLESYALSTPKTPGPETKATIMATLDYMQRLENGETPVKAPLLDKHTKKEDFLEWINRPYMQAPPDYDQVFLKIISFTPEVSTAIVWLNEGSPEETHHNEYESFFILEGTCDIIINDDIHQLYPGDYLCIPLHATHSVKVTSSIPCKLVLERKAA